MGQSLVCNVWSYLRSGVGRTLPPNEFYDTLQFSDPDASHQKTRWKVGSFYFYFNPDPKPRFLGVQVEAWQSISRSPEKFYKS
jgi:hypothetical protein